MDVGLIDESAMKSQAIKRENPFMWMAKQPLFWAEIFFMAIFPFPSNNPNSFFGLQTFDIDCINWVDYSNDGLPVGSKVYNTPYLTNDFFLGAMFLRFFFVFHTIIVLSPPNNKLVGKRVCYEQDIDPNFSFQLKSAFKERPYLLFGISSTLTIVCFSFLISIFERPYYLSNFPDYTFH